MRVATAPGAHLGDGDKSSKIVHGGRTRDNAKVWARYRLKLASCEDIGQWGR